MKNICVERIVMNYSYPIKKAAKRLSTSTANLRKIYKNYGIREWPYKKIRKYQKKMHNKFLSLNEKKEIYSNFFEYIESIHTIKHLDTDELDNIAKKFFYTFRKKELNTEELVEENLKELDNFIIFENNEIQNNIEEEFDINEYLNLSD
jgi:hypothetical protein